MSRIREVLSTSTLEANMLGHFVNSDTPTTADLVHEFIIHRTKS